MPPKHLRDVATGSFLIIDWYSFKVGETRQKRVSGQVRIFAGCVFPNRAVSGLPFSLGLLLNGNLLARFIRFAQPGANVLAALSGCGFARRRREGN